MAEGGENAVARAPTTSRDVALGERFKIRTSQTVMDLATPAAEAFVAVDQSQPILVATPPRANSGMWQVWQATFFAWWFNRSAWSPDLCGVLLWQDTQVAGLPCTALPRMCAPPLSMAVGV